MDGGENGGERIGLRIAAIYAGAFGEQILNTLSTGGFADSIVAAYELKPETIGDPATIARIWEDPDAFVPADYPPDHADLLLVLGVHGALADLVPVLARRTGARSVLYTIDDRDCAPAARRTIEQECAAAGIHIEFAMPLCSLKESPDPLIAEFAQTFGQPAFRITVDPGNALIQAAEVLRDTPCGTASAIAKILPGLSTADPGALARRCFEEHHSETADHTCLAEMDPLCPLMQEAADIVKDAVFLSCRLPLVRDLILAAVRVKGPVRPDDLAADLVDPTGRFASGTIGCITRRALDRAIEELVEEGRVVRTPGGDIISRGSQDEGFSPK